MMIINMRWWLRRRIWIGFDCPELLFSVIATEAVFIDTLGVIQAFFMPF